MFSFLGKFFKKLWNAIRKVLAVVLIIIAVILIVWSCIVAPGAIFFYLGSIAVTPAIAMLLGCLAIVGAFLVDSETASKAVGQIGDAVGDALGSIGGAVGGAASGLLGGLLKNPIGIAAIGLGVYLLLGKRDTGGKSEEEKRKALADKKAATLNQRRLATEVSPKIEKRGLNNAATI